MQETLVTMDDVRLERVEKDVETLRATQNTVLARFDTVIDLMNEVRDITIENRSRLERVEER